MVILFFVRFVGRVRKVVVKCRRVFHTSGILLYSDSQIYSGLFLDGTVY